jgi:hypothetical protein
MTGSGSKGFPTTAGSYSTNLNGMYDVFVMKFSFPDFYPKVYLQVGDVEGKPGDEVVVPIYLINGDGLKTIGVTNINVDLTYNSTLLAPIEGNISNIQNGRSILPLILPVTPDTNNIVARIRMKVGLGNDSTTVMKLENVVTIGASSQINTIDGKFTLLGICHEGGARLINSNSHSNIMSVSPNPAESSITLDFSLSESGYTEIGIYNIFGEKVKTLFSENVSDYNNRHLECNIAGLGSGQYMIIFQTPNYQQSTKLIILE